VRISNPGPSALPAINLPSSWRWAKLDEICNGVFDCPHTTPKLVFNSDYLVVRTQDILTGIFRYDSAGHVSADTYKERIQRSEPEEGDLLYSREGTYFGIAAEVPENIKVCLGQRMMLIKPKRELVNSRYLRYWLNSPLMSGYIYGYRDGSVAERLNLPTVRGLPIALPSLQVQNEIVGMLGVLDDKIEVNRRMNITLESIAQLIFREWFVDNAETRDWKIGKVEDVCISIENGGTPKRMEHGYWNNGSIAWFKTGELNDGALIDSEEKISEEGLSNSSCRLWNPKTILIALYASPTVGRLGILELPGTANQACSALIAKPEYGYLFLFHFLFLAREELQRVAVGAAQQNINQSVIKNHKIHIPPAELTLKFQETIEPLYLRQVANLKESRTLARLRDSLLPKLMRGEVRVKDVE
jgi:type I restriction enzyme S subunit